VTAPDLAAQVRSVYAAINRGDLEAIGGLVAPGFEWHPNPGELDPGVRRDREAIDRLRDFVAAFDDFRTDVEQLVELDDRVVVAVCHRGTPSGAPGSVERREAHLWAFAEDRPVSLREYPTLAEALDAAGG
jgi:ketosteroid isomerase-like protein